MDLYALMLQNTAEQFDAQQIPDTTITLITNHGNSGGHCEPREFKKDVLYRIILPTPLVAPECFVLYMYGKTVQEKDKLVTEYEESVTSFFLKFHEDVTCGFFTNAR